jgi:hypothetical protein
MTVEITKENIYFATTIILLIIQVWQRFRIDQLRLVLTNTIITLNTLIKATENAVSDLESKIKEVDEKQKS